MMAKALALFALVAVVIASGCTLQYDGSPPRVEGQRIDAVKASAASWLSTATGSSAFPSGSVLGEPIPIFDDNRTFNHWLIPMKDGNLFVGFIIADRDDFAMPYTTTNYAEPRGKIFTNSAQEAYDDMVLESVYASNTIREPYIITIENRGYYWKSEVVANGEHVDDMYVAVSSIHTDQEGVVD